MNLNKEVCKRCAERQGWLWGDEEDEMWEAQGVWCPHGSEYSISKPSRRLEDNEADPPEGCPFAAEHIVSQ